jgi:CRISPR-associated protein Csb2
MDLIRKAFEQGGLPGESVRQAAVEYREPGFRPGVDLARRYRLEPLAFPRYHVRVRWPHAVAGPLAVGAGRYRAPGLFAVE